MSISPWLTLLNGTLLALALIGCGGGGRDDLDGGTADGGNLDAARSADAARRDGAPDLTDGGQPDTAIDDVPPMIVTTVPNTNAFSVPRAGGISVVFSEPVDLATVTSASFRLETAGASVPGRVALDFSGATAIFTPAVPLGPDTIYTAMVANTVTDLAGNQLPAGHTWSFTSAGRTWDAPIGISRGLDTRDPVPALSDDGAFVAFFARSSVTSIGQAMLAHRVGGTWQEQALTSGNTALADVAVNPTGQVAIAALDWFPGSHRAFAVTTIGGNRFDLSPPPPPETTSPGIAIDAVGNAIAVYSEGPATMPTAVHARRFDRALDRWDAAVRLSTPGATLAWAPVIAMAGSGRAIIAWTETVPGGSKGIRVARFEPGIGFQASQRLDGGTRSCAYPRVAIADSGAAVVAWPAQPLLDTRPLAVFATVAAAGAPFAAESQLAPGDPNVWNPEVAILASGTAIVAWDTYYGSTPRAYGARSLPGGGFAPGTQLDANLDEAGVPSCTAARTRVHCAFMQAVGPAFRVGFRSFDEQQGWLAMTVLDRQGQFSSQYPRVAVNTRDEILVAWYGWDETTDRGQVMATWYH